MRSTEPLICVQLCISSFLISPIVVRVLLSPHLMSLFSLNSYYLNGSHLCAIDSTPFSSLFKPYSLFQQFIFSCIF